LPHIQKLYDKYRAQGLSMIAVNMVAAQNEMLPGWKAKGKYTFPVVVTEDKDYFNTNPFGIRGTPTNLLLGGDGKVVFRHIGSPPGAEKTMEAEIRELLGLDPFAEHAVKTGTGANN
jgi:hypothetical protein